jgi:phosphinothricin acetyltransferase
MKHIVRLATEYDAAQIQAIYEPYVASTPISFELDPPDASDMRRRIVETLVQYPWLVCESPEGAILGYAYGSQHRVRVAYQWSVDVSIYIGEQYHRMGAGSALYKSLLALLTMQGYCTAYAGITLPNDASVRLHESVGFTKVGVFKDTGYKLGEWLDVGWWELQLRSYDRSPKPPVPFASIALSGPVRQLLEGK